MSKVAMQKLILVFLGSGLGGVLRYVLSGRIQRLNDGTFPMGTLFVNVTGCLLAGFFAAALTGAVLIREEHRMALMVGVLGGYTTFSTFGLEAFSMFNEGQFGKSAVYAAASLVLGVTAVLVGYRLAERWLGV